MEMITAIAQTSGLIMVVVTVISMLFSYYRKAKRENERRYIENVKHFCRMASECGVSIDEACDACKVLQSKDLNEINDYTKTEWNKKNKMDYVNDISLLRSSITPSLRFVGVTTTKLTDGDTTNPISALDGSSIEVIAGTIAIYNSKEFVYTGDMWTEFDCEDYETLEPVEIKPHNCVNCGAPMPKGTTRCEYCGTEYY